MTTEHLLLGIKSRLYLCNEPDNGVHHSCLYIKLQRLNSSLQGWVLLDVDILLINLWLCDIDLYERGVFFLRYQFLVFLFSIILFSNKFSSRSEHDRENFGSHVIDLEVIQRHSKLSDILCCLLFSFIPLSLNNWELVCTHKHDFFRFIVYQWDSYSLQLDVVLFIVATKSCHHQFGKSTLFFKSWFKIDLWFLAPNFDGPHISFGLNVNSIFIVRSLEYWEYLDFVNSIVSLCTSLKYQL